MAKINKDNLSELFVGLALVILALAGFGFSGGTEGKLVPILFIVGGFVGLMTMGIQSLRLPKGFGAWQWTLAIASIVVLVGGISGFVGWSLAIPPLISALALLLVGSMIAAPVVGIPFKTR